MNLKQIVLASSVSLSISMSALAGGMNQPSYSHPEHHKKHHHWTAGWYIGAGVNWDATSSSKLPVPPAAWDNSQGTFDGDTESFKQSDNDVGFDVYVGRDFGKYFAFEVGYTMLGDQNFESTSEKDFLCPSNKAPCTQTAEVDQWNVHGVGLLKWPMGDYFDVFAKGGVAYYVNTTDFDGGLSSVYDKPNAELSTFALTYGAGLELMYQHFGIRGEYTVIAPNHTEQDNYYISDIAGVSAFYRF